MSAQAAVTTGLSNPSNDSKKLDETVPTSTKPDQDEEEEEGDEDENDDQLQYVIEDDASSGSISAESWVTNFCSMVGHEYFVEVPEEFMTDEFNLTGLSVLVPNYRFALELILDLEPEQPLKLPDIPKVEQSADLLYGLIHARFVLCRQGLHMMALKFENEQFGVCPRYLCDGMALLPIGRHDVPGYETVRLFCPCCMDIYVPPNSRYLNIDGAFFGTSFPGMFLKNFPAVEEACSKRKWKQFELKIFGFKISEFSKCGPRMKWLREKPENLEDLIKLSGEEGEGDDDDATVADPDLEPQDEDRNEDNESMVSVSMNGDQ